MKLCCIINILIAYVKWTLMNANVDLAFDLDAVMPAAPTAASPFRYRSRSIDSKACRWHLSTYFVSSNAAGSILTLTRRRQIAQVCATRGPLDINKRSSSPLIQRVYSGVWIHACINRCIAKMSRRSIAGELGLTWLRKLLQRHRLWSRNILKTFNFGLELLE